ncbi:MAG: hypothetical protein ACKVSF_08340 [Alphaproteobacteria bacterium]
MYRMYAVLALVPSLLCAAPAMAQSAQQCGERPRVLQALADRYQEVPVAMGLDANGGVVEILSNRAARTWTILVTMPNGVSCLVATGEHWESLTVASTGPKI